MYLIRAVVLAPAGRLLTRAPTRRAFVIDMDSIASQNTMTGSDEGIVPSSPALSLSISPSMAVRDVSLMFDPALLTTS